MKAARYEPRARGRKDGRAFIRAREGDGEPLPGGLPRKGPAGGDKPAAGEHESRLNEMSMMIESASQMRNRTHICSDVLVAKRWSVERLPDQFESVRADSMTVLECGALKFYSGSLFDPKDILVIAPGEWVTVCEAEEDEA